MNNIGNLGIFVLVLATWFAPALFAVEGDSVLLEKHFRELTKDTNWRPTSTHEVSFPTHHPQGMTAVNDRFFLSSVEVVDRAADEGVGHLFEMDRNGVLTRQITLGEGALYHPGGIDYDGARLWVPVAAYRPDSAAIMYTVNPDTLESQEVFRFDDHLGAAAHCPEQNLLVAVSWGSRRFYRWDTVELNGRATVPDPANPLMQPNGSHYIDYQDMQRIPGTTYMLCSGLRSYQTTENRLAAFRLGGIELVDMKELRAHHQVPVPVRPPAAPAWTQNPFYVQATEQGLRFFFVPEDNKSSIHIFEVEKRQ